MNAKQRRSVFLEWCGAAMCAVLPFTAAVAQSYPVKPIRIFVGFAAGSSATDMAARMPVPTIHETGVACYARTGWYGLIGPAGIPNEILSKLNATIAQVVNAPDMKAAFFRQGLETETNTPEQFTEMIRREVDQNIQLTRASGIKPE